jgi:peptidoglycan/LPS O-acetylase OafA/YrhL
VVGATLIVLANFARFEYAYHSISGVATWFDTLTHLDSIGFGIVLAAFPHRWFSSRTRFHRCALVAVGLACWLTANNYYNALIAADSVWQEILSYPLGAEGNAAILAATIGASSNKVINVFGRFLVYLGKISYGLYVFHGFGITLTKLVFSSITVRTATDPFILQLLKQFVGSSISLIVTLCIAACSYAWLESPFLRLKGRFTVVTSRPV